MKSQTIKSVFPPIFENHFPLDSVSQKIVDDFHNLYFNLHEKKSGLQLSWLGYQTGKLPSDLWIYQEILFHFRPQLIIECGTHKGGSALFLANICQLIGVGTVVTVDLYEQPNRPDHPLVKYLQGSSTSQEVFNVIQTIAAKSNNILVILDSNHAKDHVLEELSLYSKLIQPGGLIVVEDSFLNGHPSHQEFGPGPMEAIDLFIRENPGFTIDRSFEKFLFTLNRRGFLRRIT